MTAPTPFTLPEGVTIEPRRVHVELDTAPTYWVAGEAFPTRFIEALSMFFPDGERFFVEAVMANKKRITDPAVLAQIEGFARQEGLHSSEHRKYNERLAGPSARTFQKVAKVLLSFPKRHAPPKARLAITVALEHWTAILAHQVLSDPRYLGAMHPEHAKLWRWHAREETEHKGVAFDVYQAVGGSYALRARAMLVSSIFFIGASFGVTAVMLHRDGELLRWRTLDSLKRWGFTDPGLYRAIARPWLAYFRRDFHPWQHDNAHLVREPWSADGTPVATAMN